MAAAVQAGFPITDFSASARTSITKAVTIGAGAGNLELVVFTFHEEAGGAVSGVTWNGTALTKIDSIAATTWSHVECWHLVAPATGTFNVVATKASTADFWGIAVYVLEGVDQTTSFRTPAKGSANSGTSTSHTVAGVSTGDLTLDALSIDSTGHNASVGADQAKDFGPTQNGGPGSNEAQASRQTTTDGVMSWTWTSSAPNSHLAVAFIAAAGGGSNKAITPAAITSTSSMSGEIQELQAIVPAAITASSTITAALGRLRPVTLAAITATSSVAAALTKQGTAPISPAAITSTSTVSGALVRLVAITPGSVQATSDVTATITGGSSDRIPTMLLLGVG